jgi:hypothetical protein
MRSCSSDAAPENETFALSKLGGPMKPFAWFETTVPSVGTAVVAFSVIVMHF